MVKVGADVFRGGGASPKARGFVALAAATRATATLTVSVKANVAIGACRGSSVTL